MSAFCGFLNLDSAPADPALVAAQLARLKHRGPDGAGTFTDGPVALGHALLSITPESVAEPSPWRSRDGQIVIAFDGRLDHRDDLCGTLGVPLTERGVPDPDLILRAYEKWGVECAAKIEGEFAFALWDGRKRELFCARDVFGHRGFYYHLDSRRFIFASTIRGVLAVPGVPRELDELVLACRLCGLPQPADRTFYLNLRCLSPAHSLKVRPGAQPEARQYWKLAMEPEIRLRSPEEYAEALRELIERATRSALRVRHPVAVMLSGGLDSTGVACLAARELGARGQRITTVSGILPEDYQGEEWNREESAFIRSTLEQHSNMDPHWSRGLALPVVDFDDSYYDHHDEPNVDNKSFRTGELAHLAEQQGARILIGGMGGDMAPSMKGTGYLEQLARTGHWLELARQLRLQGRIRQTSAAGIFKREVLRPLSPLWLRRWHDHRRLGPRSAWHGLPIHPDFAARLPMDAILRAAGHDRDRAQDIRPSHLHAVNAGQLGIDCRWVAHHSPRLESPQPLMDRRIWEWSYRVPLVEFVRDGLPRSLYRRALHDVLPEKVLRRTSKGWFAPDYQQRLAACRPAMEAFLVQHPASDAVWSYVDRRSVEATLRHMNSPGSGDTWDNRYQLILCQGLRLAHFISWLGRPTAAHGSTGA